MAEAKGGLTEQVSVVTRALQLLDTETADAIIGGHTEQYDALVQGMDGAYKMLWQMTVSNGLRISPGAVRMGAQAEAIMLTLVHYAYALGINEGERRANGGADSSPI